MGAILMESTTSTRPFRLHAQLSTLNLTRSFPEKGQLSTSQVVLVKTISRKRQVFGSKFRSQEVYTAIEHECRAVNERTVKNPLSASKAPRSN